MCKLIGKATGNPGDNFINQLSVFLESLFDEEDFKVCYDQERKWIEIKWVAEDKKTCRAIKKAAVAYTKAHRTVWGEFFAVHWEE